ncbi:hypothetical protein [Burkholderia sp. BCC1047]|uniref:hypothetical protein n=1 Tax=Burkholderia sp. BCC1047 TaxID=2676299 RepID=UPI00158D4E11|nr:hypothetical protein [Burkholderia sp. BCC1047]
MRNQLKPKLIACPNAPRYTASWMTRASFPGCCCENANAPDLLLICAVAIGDLEARPMTVFKLAEYIGMPRGIEIRRLARMTRAGPVVKDGMRRYTLTEKARRRAAGVV